MESNACCVPKDKPQKLQRIDILRTMPIDTLADFLAHITTCCHQVGYYQEPDIEDCKIAGCPFANGLYSIRECDSNSIMSWLEEDVEDENTSNSPS